MSGTSGEAKRLEGIEIKLVGKGSVAPGNTANHYFENKSSEQGTNATSNTIAGSSIEFEKMVTVF